MEKHTWIILNAFMCTKCVHIKSCMSDEYEIFTLYLYIYAHSQMHN